MPKKKTLKEFESEMLSRDKDYSLTENSIYINDSTPLEIKHLSCGRTFMMRPGKFLGTPKVKGNRCPYCFGTPKKTIKEVQQMAKDNNCILLSKEYKNNKEDLTFKCLDCNTVFKTPYNTFARKNLLIKCPECRKKYKNNSRVKTNEDFIKEVNEVTNGEYTVISDYKTCRDKVVIRHNCEKCNNTEFEVKPTNFLSNGTRCPVCSKGNISKKEKDVLEYIKSIYNGKIITNSKNIINGYELDIYIPEYKIAFEFDGLYYHSEKFVSNDYHLNKSIKCEENDIRLIHIFEDEWDYKNDIVKDKIKYLLHQCTNKIYARKCTIVEMNKNERKEFLDDNHIQGNDSAQIALGLKYEDKIVACMTFCKPRVFMNLHKSNKYDYELSRYTSLRDHSVIGGFSKLFKYFINNYKDCNKIITYADFRWSNGNVYDDLMELDHISRPNYFYLAPTNKNKRLYRYQFKKQSIKEKFPEIYNEALTEREMMKSLGYLRIYDCGNLAYIWERKN